VTAGRGSVTAGRGSVPAERGAVTAGSGWEAAERGAVTAGSGWEAAERGAVTAGSGWEAAERGSVTAGSGSVTPGSGSVKVATILFDDGSTSLGYQERGILQQVADLYQRRGGTVRVIGHASSRTRNMDPDRHRKVNYGISVERASEVARELAKLGVPSEMIVVSAMADEEPVYREVMPSGEAGNRRAEIYIDY
jgi:flagellar motor protein MotB